MIASVQNCILKSKSFGLDVSRSERLENKLQEDQRPGDKQVNQKTVRQVARRQEELETKHRE